MQEQKRGNNTNNNNAAMNLFLFTPSLKIIMLL